jgi:hypothetical protein
VERQTGPGERRRWRVKPKPLFVAENGRMNRVETFEAFARSRGVEVDEVDDWKYFLADDETVYVMTPVRHVDGWHFAVFTQDSLHGEQPREGGSDG